jgi:hypothetical protein
MNKHRVKVKEANHGHRPRNEYHSEHCSKADFLQPFQQFQLSACVAVGTCQFFSKYDADSFKIKWPNDIYWRDRKLGGILIENIIRSHEPGVANWDWAVAGIGMNINQTNFADGLKNPVSLKQSREGVLIRLNWQKTFACLSIIFTKGSSTKRQMRYWKCITINFTKKMNWSNLRRIIAVFQPLLRT